MDFAFVLCDHTGKPLPGSHLGQRRRLVYALNRAVEAQLTYSAQDEATGRTRDALRNGIPQLKVYRDGDLDLTGHWHPMRLQGSADEQSTMDLVFRDAYGELAYRYLRADIQFVAEDVGQMIVALIGTTNALSDTTLRVDSVETTIARDQTFEAGKNHSEAGIQLTELDGGPDFECIPLDPQERDDGVTGALRIVRSLGQERSTAKFEFGPETLANLKGYESTVQRPVNRVLGIGSGEPPLRSEPNDAASEALYRSQMKFVANSDLTTQQVLADKTAAELRPSPSWITQITPDPAMAPMFGTDFQMGDTVPVNIRDGEIELSLMARVVRVEIGLGDSNEIQDYIVGFDTEGENV